jgi:tetratricopeptide (TPR) repeat protein
MSPRSMLADLSRRLDVLSAGPNDFSPRQRSIRGALDWSYDLLEPAERLLLGRLTVFAAAATDAAIERVCGAGARQAVRSLADKSLMTVVEVAGEPRFGMFQVIHEYAQEKWCEQEDAAARESFVQRCAAYFADEAGAVPPALRGPDQQRWLEHVHAELDDLRAALAWSLAHQDGELAGRLGGGLWPFWRRRGLYHEGRRWLDQVLGLGARVPDPQRAAVLNGAGVLALMQTDYASAEAHLDASRSLYAALGDPFGEAFVTSNLGWLARNREQVDLAQELFEASLRQRRDIGDVWGEAWTLNNLGVVALDRLDLGAARALLSESVELFRRVADQSGSLQALNGLGWVLEGLGEYAQARTLFEESLSLARDLADARGVANCLGDLASMAMYTGDYARANELFEDSLAAYAALGDQRNVASCIEGLAGVAAVAGRPVDAARLFGLAAARRESLGAPLMAMDRGRYEETLAAARGQLDDASWQRAWNEGQRSSVAELLPPLAP